MVTNTDKFAYKNRCVWIIDFNHVIHRYFNAMKAGNVNLSATVEVERVDEYGITFLEKVVVDTGVLSGVLKAFVKLSGNGSNPMVICHDSKNISRKAYFRDKISSGEIYSSRGAYKDTRVSMNPHWKKSADLCLTLLKNTGAYVIGKEDYEADDLIAEAVRVAKLQYPDLPICILANDLDLAPLIDEQVSLYKTPTKLTFAFDGYPSVKSYGQITPRNYQRVLEDTTLVKKLGTGAPYNMLLLSKIIRGDSSDNIDCMKGFYRKPQRLKDMIQGILENEPDYADIFRYYHWKSIYKNKETGDTYTEYPRHLINKSNKNQWKIELEAPAQQMGRMGEVLGKYGMSDEEIFEFFHRYHGMNLNGAFIWSDNPKERRKPFVLNEKVTIPSLDIALVSLEASRFQINI